jgi:dihydrofolate reductase
MPIALIAAVAGKNLVIGKDGDLPWHFPADLKHFKATTVNHTVLMGRKTYQSILNRLGKPLPGRRNIVLTRDRNFRDERVTVIHDLSEIPRTEETLFVIGGAEIYRQTLPLADQLYITHIGQEISGDAFFPPIDPAKWVKRDEQKLTENGVELRFVRMEKVQSA